MKKNVKSKLIPEKLGFTLIRNACLKNCHGVIVIANDPKHIECNTEVFLIPQHCFFNNFYLIFGLIFSQEFVLIYLK